DVHGGVIRRHQVLATLAIFARRNDEGRHAQLEAARRLAQAQMARVGSRPQSETGERQDRKGSHLTRIRAPPVAGQLDTTGAGTGTQGCSSSSLSASSGSEVLPINTFIETPSASFMTSGGVLWRASSSARFCSSATLSRFCSATLVVS